MKFFKDTYGIRKRVNRPYGRVPVENSLNDMLEAVDFYVEQLSSNTDVEAISLGGGLSRGFGDSLSEIDLNVYVKPEILNDWEMGKGPIPHGDYLGDKYHMDVSFFSIDTEKEKEWILLQKWDSSYVKILYDPEEKLNNLLSSKDVFTAKEKYQVALTNYLNCVYHGDIIVRQWILRQDPLVANQILSNGINSLCILLFLANDEYPPFDKWLINYSYSLSWKPEDWETRLNEITLIQEISFDELERRKTVFKELYLDIWGKVIGEEHREIGLLELDTLESLQYIIDNKPIVEKYIDKYGHRPLGCEVLYKLTELVEINGEKRIQFNEELFIDEQKNGFSHFLDWNKRMLEYIQLNQFTGK